MTRRCIFANISMCTICNVRGFTAWHCKPLGYIHRLRKRYCRDEQLILSKIDNNNNRNQIQQNSLMWLFIYMSIGLTLSLILPFPISLAVLVLVLFLLNIIRTEIALRKAGTGGIKGLYKSFCSLGFGSRSSNGVVGTPLKFYCMNCGNEHRKIACPKCGSKAVKAGQL